MGNSPSANLLCNQAKITNKMMNFFLIGYSVCIIIIIIFFTGQNYIYSAILFMLQPYIFPTYVQLTSGF